jgi:hypothetical protein
MPSISAEIAARQLAKELDLPASRVTVFAWFSAGQPKIVVRADRVWLSHHRKLPASYLGYRVEADDAGDAVAFS